MREELESVIGQWKNLDPAALAEAVVAWSAEDSAPVDVAAMAIDLGLEVYFADFDDPETLSLQVGRYPSDRRIYIKDEMSVEDRRLLIAMNIYTALNRYDESEYQVRRVAAGQDDEDASLVFARGAIMPAGLLETCLGLGLDTAALAALFDIQQVHVRSRIGELGLSEESSDYDHRDWRGAGHKGENKGVTARPERFSPK